MVLYTKGSNILKGTHLAYLDGKQQMILLNRKVLVYLDLVKIYVSSSQLRSNLLDFTNVLYPFAMYF